MQYLKRRRYLINRSVQYSATAAICGLVLVALAIHTALDYWTLAPLVEPAKRGALASILFRDLLVAGAMGVALGALIAVFGSHRIAGPLYRISAALRRVREGDVTPIVKLRKGDLLMDFAEEFNFALAHLRDLAAEDRAQVEEAIRLVTLARAGVSVPEAQMSLDRAILALRRVGLRLKIDDRPPAAPPAAPARSDDRTMALARPIGAPGPAGAAAAPPPPRSGDDRTMALPRPPA